MRVFVTPLTLKVPLFVAEQFRLIKENLNTNKYVNYCQILEQIRNLAIKVKYPDDSLKDYFERLAIKVKPPSFFAAKLFSSSFDVEAQDENQIGLRSTIETIATNFTKRNQLIN